MNNAFNPYHEWLGVSADIRYPNYYELLGIRPLEDNQEIIKWAADQRSRYLEQLLPGEQGLLARQILGEIAAARSCLLDHQSKAAYDQQLAQLPSARTGDGPLPAFAPPVATEQPMAGPPSLTSDGPPPSFAPPIATEQPTAPPPPPPFSAQLPHQNRQMEPSETHVDEASPPPTVSPPTGTPLMDAPPTVAPPSRPSSQQAIRPAPKSMEASAAEPSPPGLPAQDDEPSAPSVPMVGRETLEPVLEELEQAMQQCCELYLSCVPHGGATLEGAALELSLSQDRLHKYLLVKICATVAGADGRWSHEEQQCGAAVLRHVGLPFSSSELDGIAALVKRHAEKLEWQKLVQPFRELPELRDKMTQLQNLVLRVANLIATADGSVLQREKEIMQEILDQLRPARQCDTAAKPRQSQAETTSTMHDVKHGRRNGEVKERKPVRRVSAAAVQENLERLDELVGLHQVKQEIYGLANFVSQQRQSSQTGSPLDLNDSHYVFIGSVGTGKSEVAQVLSNILVAAGALDHSGLVEVNSAILAANDPAQAAGEMDASVSAAAGGTLLIDDAGALFSDTDPSSSAAMRVLLQGMAEHQGELVVILADRSDRLRQEINQRADLATLFGRHLHFPDYSVSQLGQIFQRFCDLSGYKVSRLAQIKLLLAFQWRLGRDGELFGNGHLIRQVFEDAVYCLGQRIDGVSPLTAELLTTFEDGDIIIDGVPAGAWSNLADARRRFLIHCPGCMKASRVASKLLGVTVKCNRCHQRFVCAWGEPCEAGPGG